MREWVEGALNLLGPRLAEKGLDLRFEVADGVPGSCETPASDFRQFAGQRGEVCERGEVVVSVPAEPRNGGRVEAERWVAYLTKPAKPAQLCAALAGLFRPEPAAGPPVATHPCVAAGVAEASRSEAVLRAEDQVVNPKVALVVSATPGFRAEVAANGHEVIAAVQRQHYDLGTCRCRRIDGLEASRRILGLWLEGRDRPGIIALTANAMQGDRELCLTAGMDDSNSKPMETGEPAAALERLELVRRLPQ